MKIGLFLSAQFPPGASVEEGVAEIVAQARLADELGYDAVFLGHHYLARASFLQPLTLAAHLASVTERIRIGFGVLVAPLYNPLGLAEEIATIDALSGGRLIVGLGAGYRKVECSAFGVEWQDRVTRLREYVPILRALWNGEAVTASGSWGSLDGAEVHLRPSRPGGPPIWLGALADAGIRRAARLGVPWLIGPEGSPEDIAGRLALYRETAVGAGHPPDGREVPLTREAFVAATTDEAVATMKPYLAAQYAGYRSWDAAQAIDLDEFIRTHCLVGAPDDVARRITALGDDLGITYLVLRMQFMGMPGDAARAGIRAFGEQVLPRLAGRASA